MTSVSKNDPAKRDCFPTAVFETVGSWDDTSLVDSVYLSGSGLLFAASDLSGGDVQATSLPTKGVSPQDIPW